MRSWTVITVGVLLGGLAACATSAVARDWLRPVDGAVVRPFSVSDVDRFAAGQHRGIDLAAAPGAVVRAACAGRVSFAGRVPGGGRTVSVRCGPLIATYQHLGSVTVARGQAVPPGGRIGRAGQASPAPHVHLGARVAATGEYRDPAALFGGAPPWPLAPVPAPRRAP
ncbi:MAG: peptidoglycan DD-metalloendopeptidase family protein, partial [Solirubrobacteraceae bacterium]|nr:peptidoglycan DD-metalloendopeptidase family protein [Solirubrobacteraceae bacterium]